MYFVYILHEYMYKSTRIEHRYEIANLHLKRLATYFTSLFFFLQNLRFFPAFALKATTKTTTQYRLYHPWLCQFFEMILIKMSFRMFMCEHVSSRNMRKKCANQCENLDLFWYSLICLFVSFRFFFHFFFVFELNQKLKYTETACCYW